MHPHSLITTRSYSPILKNKNCDECLPINTTNPPTRNTSRKGIWTQKTYPERDVKAGCLGQMENQTIKFQPLQNLPPHGDLVATIVFRCLNLGGMLLSEPRHKIVDLRWMFLARVIGRASGEWRVQNKNIMYI